MAVGDKWTKKEDKKLTKLFHDARCYQEMADILNRTWFGCKCRLARLGLIPGFVKSAYVGYMSLEDAYVVPKYQYKTNNDEIIYSKPENPVIKSSSTFSNEELDIIADWFKTKLARMAVNKITDPGDTVRQSELKLIQEVCETELRVVKSLSRMSLEERERVLKRFA